MLVLFLVLTRLHLVNIQKSLFLEALPHVLRSCWRKWARKHDEELLAILLISPRHHDDWQTVVFDSLRSILRAAFSLKPSDPQVDRGARARAILPRCFLAKFDVRENDRHGRLRIRGC